MNVHTRILILGWLAAVCVLPLRATDFAQLRAGDIAAADIVTPVALDVVDPQATAARQSAEAAKVPAIFRDFPRQATNALTADFTSSFAAARKDFSAGLSAWFAKSRLADSIISSAGFTDFLSAYDKQHPEFPPTFELAAEWARGNSGVEIQTKLLARLQQMMHRPVWDEVLPPGFSVGEKIRVVPVSRPDEAPTLEFAEQNGKLITATNLTGVTRLRMLFRHSFPKSEADFATALAGFLRPLCAPDAALTQQARDQAAREIQMATHYEPGQLIVRRGELINEKALSAIDQLRGRNLLPAGNPAPVQSGGPPAAVSSGRDVGVWVALSVVTLISITAVIFAWRARAGRTTVSPPARFETVGTLAPQLSQAVRDALVQELAATRVELLKAQHFASARVVSVNGNETKNGMATETRAGKAVASILAEGQAFLDAGEPEKALKCFDAALALQPDHAEIHVKMGGAFDKLGQVDDALRCFDRAIAADDSQPVAYLLKGGLFNRLARYEEASQCYEQALRKQKKSAA